MRTLIYFLAGAVFVLADDSAVKDYLVQSSNKVAFNIFNEVLKNNVQKSVVISGFSVLPPLAQLGLASVGATHDEVLKAIGLPNDNITQEMFVYANKKIDSKTGVVLEVANSIFIPENYELNDEFHDISRDVFRSEVKKTNFAKNTVAATTINEWVELHTHNYIKDLITPESLNQDTAAVLVNAIYFKGNWTEGKKFNPALTKFRDFHVTKDVTVKVPTMTKRATYEFLDSKESDAKFLSIPYEAEHTTLVLALPNKVDGVAALHKQLSAPGIFRNTLRLLSPTVLDVYLPKFKVETRTDLKDVLKKTGVVNLFDPLLSELDNLVKNSKDLYISNAVQKAFFVVHEDGTEAAAATAFGGLSSSFQVATNEFVADHPFLFYLVDDDSILFNGVYYGEDN